MPDRPASENPVELRFTQSGEEKRSWLPWGIAGAVIVLGLAALLFLGGHRSTTTQPVGSGVAPLDPYAGNLAMSNVHMSEASNFAGSKVTYLDGQVTNRGEKTLIAVNVQVVFRNDLKEIAQRETMPLSLIRTREPYVDTQPMSATPLKPGEEREFRLIFDSVAADWNQQYPEIRVVQVTGR